VSRINKLKELIRQTGSRRQRLALESKLSEEQWRLRKVERRIELIEKSLV
jgi:hypothetical protein